MKKDVFEGPVAGEQLPPVDMSVERDYVDSKTWVIWRSTGAKAKFNPLPLPPLLVYRAMKSKYGEPNSGIDEWKQQWAYKVRGFQSTIEVYDTKLFYWFLRITPDEDVDPQERRKIVEREWFGFLSWLKRACRRAKVTGRDYKHVLILNGYKPLYDNGNYFMERAETKGKEPTGDPMLWAAATSFILSVEAFFNSLFDVYLKPEFRENSDVASRIAMFSMLEKWSLASSLCYCFPGPLDRRSKSYEALRRLVTLRNNMAHVNMSRHLKTYLVEEDGMEFVIPPDFQLYQEAMEPNSLTMPAVQRIKSDVDLVVSGITGSMKPRERRQFPKLLQGDGIVIHRTRDAIRMSQWF